MGADFCVDEVNKVILGTTAVVSNCLRGTGGEVLDRREALDAEFFGKGFAVLSFAVNLGDDNIVVTSKVIGAVFPGRSELLTV